MRNLNSLLLEGTLLDAPVLSHATSSNEPDRCIFSIASEPEAAFIPVVAYGRLALSCSQILTKDSVIRVVGHIAQDPEATAATGSFRLCVIAEHIEPKPSTLKPVPVEATDVGF
jgi:single-stranded DNA-binding protein